MYINNEDLEFLICLENKLGIMESWSEDVTKLWLLIEKLTCQRDVTRKRTAKKVAERRKTDKNYARPKVKQVKK